MVNLKTFNYKNNIILEISPYFFFRDVLKLSLSGPELLHFLKPGLPRIIGLNI